MSEATLGAKYQPRPRKSGHETRFNNRTLTVLSEVDGQGRVHVLSENSAIGTKKHQVMLARRLLSSAYRAIPLLMLGFLVACAHAPKAPATPAAACQKTPQWYVTDAQGKASTGIFVCFGDNHQLMYDARKLTADEVKAAEPAPIPAPAPRPGKLARHKKG